MRISIVAVAAILGLAAGVAPASAAPASVSVGRSPEFLRVKDR